MKTPEPKRFGRKTHHGLAQPPAPGVSVFGELVKPGDVLICCPPAMLLVKVLAAPELVPPDVPPEDVLPVPLDDPVLLPVVLPLVEPLPDDVESLLPVEELLPELVPELEPPDVAPEPDVNVVPDCSTVVAIVVACETISERTTGFSGVVVAS